MPITGRFDADFTPFLDAVNQANKALVGIEGEATKLNTAMDRLVAGQGWAQKIAEGELLHDAIVEEAFRHLADQAGLAADVLLNQLRAGTHGTIDDFALMQRANENMAAGLNLTEAQFKILADGAYALAKATGTDTKDALDKMSDAMVTGRTKGIALLTGQLDLKAAEAEYADHLRGTGQELTAEGKLEVDREAILARVGTRLDALGVQHESLDDKVKQAQISWQNFEHQLGASIAQSPVLEAGFRGLAEALGLAFGDQNQTLITSITQLVDTAAIGVVDLATVTVQAGVVIVENFAKAKASLLELGEVLTVVRDPGRLTEFVANTKAIGEEWVKTTATARSAGDDYLRILDDTRVQMLKARDDAGAAADKNKELAATQREVGTAAAGAGRAIEDTGAQLVPATQYTKQYVTAWEELNSQGRDFAGTAAGVDAALREQIEYYLTAGASLKTLADAYPQVSAEQIKAIDALQKRSEAAAADITKIWNEYTDVVGTGSETAYEKATKAIDKWYADEIAKHQAAKTDTAAFYDALAALDDAKYAKLTANRLADDTDSKASLDKKAHADEEAYQFALANQDQFSQAHLEKLRVDAEQSRLAAEGWGLGWEDASQKAKKGVDDVAASMRQVTDDTNRAADARNSFSFAGGAAVADKFKGMSQEAMRLAGYIDLYGKVTPVGEAAGLGDSGGPIRPRASGGPVEAGTPYLVGEQGPELFVPASNGSIAANGSAGVVVHNTFNIVDTESNIARRVSDQITRSVMRSARLS
jgi:hypothetical protein